MRTPSVENLTSSEFEVKARKPKVLFFDIETAALKIRAWKTWKTHAIAVDEDWFMLSFSAKWQNGKHVTKCLADYEGYEAGHINDKALVTELSAMCEEADMIVAHNGDRFDLKRLRTRMIYHGMKPLPPEKTVDTLKVCRNRFAFSQNSLKAVAKALGCEAKMDSGGFEIWQGCEAGDPKAWKQLKRYNKQDVVVLMQVYEKLKPWIFNHPNLPALQDIEDGCRNCGSRHLQRRGWTPTPTGARRRIQCMDCSTWLLGGHKKVTDIR